MAGALGAAFQTLRESFAPMRIRNLRIYLGGQAVSLLGTWMQVTAQSWVVWELSESETALGIVAMLGMLPFLLLAPWAGAWADRLDRRKLLIGLQAASMALAVALALLVQIEVVQLWHVYVLAALLGIVGAIDMPAQQAFIGDVVGMGALRKAIVMNVIILQISRMLGPALAGLVIQQLGVSPAFWINAVSFVAVIVSLVAVRSEQIRRPAGGAVLREFRDSLVFAWRKPRIIDLLTVTILVTFFAMSTMQIMPAFASKVLNGGADALGLLMGSSGAGALFSALLVVPLAQKQRMVGKMLGGSMLWAAAWLLVFSFSDWMWLSMLAIAMVSIGVPVVMTTANGLLQLMAPPDMRARLISLMLMVGFGSQPLAALLMGRTAELLGPQRAVLISGLLLLAGTVAYFSVRPALRGWELGAGEAPPAPPVPLAETGATKPLALAD